MARLLVVEDDPNQAALRTLILRHAGHEVFTAGSKEEAERLLAENPSLVILDMHIPDLEQGISLARAIKQQRPAPRIIAISGFPEDLRNLPEFSLLERVLTKPVRSQLLVDLVSKLALFVLCFLVCRTASGQPSTHPFQLDAPAEVVAEVELSAPGAEWGRTGKEAAMAVLTLDNARTQHIMAYMGAARHTYQVFLGPAGKGVHELKIDRHADYSARGIPLLVHKVTFRQYTPADADYPVIANAPVIHARANTLGKFTDIPLLMWCEKLPDGSLRYSVIFSNEDGGTSTRGLMARWGRVTDIEYVYQVWLDKAGTPTRTLIQTRGHKDVEFRGKHEGQHPLLTVVTDNNMVSDDAPTAVRYQSMPIVTELKNCSRECVMDEYPFTYTISARELEREGKLRKFATAEGQKISAPENYLVVEMRLLNKEARVALMVRLMDENFYRTSHLGAHDLSIERSGWARTAIELPPATQPGQVAEIAIQCLPEAKTDGSGSCRVDSISRIFFLDSQQRPDTNFWRPRNDRGPWILAPGQVRVVPVR
ncbi:MAG: response regulator [Acidobacteria bacterium]|nr:response regulator [Acidobacteriota bacterium]